MHKLCLTGCTNCVKPKLNSTIKKFDLECVDIMAYLSALYLQFIHNKITTQFIKQQVFRRVLNSFHKTYNYYY